MTTGGGDPSSKSDADSLLRAVAAAPERPVESMPARIAHFRILGKLGQGGMGVVYRAEDEQLRRTVALKLLPESSRDEEKKQRFLREARSAAGITHPNVAVVYQVGEADGRIYIAMELVEGESLRARLDRERLDVATARELAVQIARGLSAAHDKAIVHRDLKPENVMITPAGLVKILDFGLAKPEVARRSSGPTEAALAKTETLVTSDEGRIMGTPEYMSPEQALGEAVDVRSDVFSFGIVLYEMLAGVRPFTGASTGAVLVAIARDAAPPLRERAPQVDEATEALVHQCLAKKPGDRPASATGIAAALSVRTASQPTAPSRSDVQPITRSGTKRPLPRMAVAAALTFAAVSAIAWWGLSHPTASPSAAAVAPSASVSATEDSPAGFAEVPMSPTTSDVARVKFREAMELEAAGDWAAADVLDAALAADPSFASAALQRAYLAFVSINQLGPADRAAFHTALAHHDDLGARDRALLDALAPSFGDPPDWRESERRMREYLAARPHDGQAWHALGMLLDKQERYGEVPSIYAREAALEPRDVAAYQTWAQVLWIEPDHDGAERVLADCIARRPENVSCRIQWADFAGVSGDCREMDRLAREATAVNQDSVDAWDMRARAAAGMGAPDEAIADLQATARSHVAQPDVRARRDRDVAEAMAVRRGELATAVRLVDEDERDVPTRGWDRGALSSLEVSRVQLLWETGDTKGSGHVAEAFLKRLPALARPERAFNDSTPTFLAYAFAGGSIGADTLRARRAAWLTEQRERYGDEGWAKIRVLAWADAYFAPGEPTPAQAADAFAALGDLGGEMPEPDAWRYEDQLVPIGALCLAAGRLDEAVRWLSLAANVCRVTPPVHAQYLLARTHETRGEKAEACTGYTTVLQAWGRARPRSVTADAARLHMKRLGCEGPAK